MALQSWYTTLGRRMACQHESDAEGYLYLQYTGLLPAGGPASTTQLRHIQTLTYWQSPGASLQAWLAPSPSRTPTHLGVACKAVQHARRFEATRLLQDLSKALPRIPAMHKERLVQLPRQLHLRGKPALLDVGGAEVAVKVQPTLACMKG